MGRMHKEAVAPLFELKRENQLHFSGCWQQDQSCPPISAVQATLKGIQVRTVQLSISDSFEWDSLFMSRLYQCWLYCQEQGLVLDISQLPNGVQQLFHVATAVSPVKGREESTTGFVRQLMSSRWINNISDELLGIVHFIGEVTIATGRLCRGQANTRWSDFFYFVQQAGPNALGLLALISVLVGMILAYLGLVQLRYLGAEVYVANLVTIGMVREMGALMTAVVMAGRTGASYAAQLGTMQANEEIDAITTLGISPIEFLVLPRMLALICVMPMLCLFSDAIGLVGGAIVALGMDITFFQYIAQSREAIDLGDIFAGLFKSLIFAILIAIAGCRAGIQSGRSSAAVGEATTKAVVTATIYLVVADAGLNIIYDKMGI